MKKKTIAIIPARGGSKGIKNKNIRMFNGYPLIYWSIKQAQNSKCISDVYVTSDSTNILKVAKELNCKLIKRPKNISGDNDSSESALIHALSKIDLNNIKYIVFLQCTSPLRKDDDIDNCYSQIVKEKKNSILSVSKHEGITLFTIKNKKIESATFNMSGRKTRQKSEMFYNDNGSIYMFKPNNFLKIKNRIDPKSYSLFEMDQIQSLEIDTLKEFNSIEKIHKNNFLKTHINSSGNYIYKDLKNKNVVLTGGNGYLGYYFTAELLNQGANVIIIDKNRQQKKLFDLNISFPNRLHYYQLNLSNKTNVISSLSTILKKFKFIDILINCASISFNDNLKLKRKYFSKFENYDPDLWEHAFKINLSSTFLVTQVIGKNMLKNKKGNIINISSDVSIISPDQRIYSKNLNSGYKGVNFNTPLSYSVSKSGINSFTRFLATYWSKKGIRVNSISPAGVYRSHEKGFVKELTNRIPLGRMAKPEEICAPLMFLCSESSSFMTGTNLVVDGGRTIW